MAYFYAYEYRQISIAIPNSPYSYLAITSTSPIRTSLSLSPYYLWLWLPHSRITNMLPFLMSSYSGISRGYLSHRCIGWIDKSDTQTYLCISISSFVVWEMAWCYDLAYKYWLGPCPTAPPYFPKGKTQPFPGSSSYADNGTRKGNSSTP